MIILPLTTPLSSTEPLGQKKNYRLTGNHQEVQQKAFSRKRKLHPSQNAQNQPKAVRRLTVKVTHQNGQNPLNR